MKLDFQSLLTTIFYHWDPIRSNSIPFSILDLYFVWSSVYRWRVYCCNDSINYSNWKRTLGVRIQNHHQPRKLQRNNIYIMFVFSFILLPFVCVCAVELASTEHKAHSHMNLFHCFCKNVNNSMKGNQQILFALHKQTIGKARTERPPGLWKIWTFLKWAIEKRKKESKKIFYGLFHSCIKD